MGKTRDISNPLNEVSFVCAACKHKFERAPDVVEDAPERTWHPWRYFADCIKCGAQCKQAGWEQGLMATYGKHTGPKTAAGKAATTKNIEPYQTSEQGRRNRFNGLKHGLYSQQLDYFPARPGQYDKCKSCTIDHDTCRANTICAREADMAMRYQIAFSENDPSQLRDIQAGMHARIQSIIDSIMLAIINTGVEIHQPVWYVDPKDGFQLAEYDDSEGQRKFITEVRAHPLLKVLSEYISRNNLSLSDMGMTPKQHDEGSVLKGQIDSQEQNGEELLEYQRRQAESLEGLQEMIKNSQARTKADPILIEHGESVG